MDERPYSYRRVLAGCLIIAFAIFLCTSVSLLGINQVCINNLNRLLPFYPGSRVVSERHNFISSFGMGETVIELYAPENYKVVTAWYGRTVGAYMRERLQTGGINLGDGNWAVTEAEDGVGSQVLLYAKCVN
jgi:hypothetical protein